MDFPIHAKLGVTMKLVGLSKMYLNETHSEAHLGKHFSDTVFIQNSLQLLYDYCFSTCFRTHHLPREPDGVKLNRTHQLLVYVHDVNVLGDNIHTIQMNTENLTDANKEVGPEVKLCACKCLVTRMQDKTVT
jgi:hypothetical protein